MKQTASNYYFSQIIFDVSTKKEAKGRVSALALARTHRTRIKYVQCVCIMSHTYKHNIIKHSTFTSIQYARIRRSKMQYVVVPEYGMFTIQHIRFVCSVCDRYGYMYAMSAVWLRFVA